MIWVLDFKGVVTLRYFRQFRDHFVWGTLRSKVTTAYVKRKALQRLHSVVCPPVDH
jgi:hypothetical protein